MKQYAIIVAGGSGTRMGSDVPKQFSLLKGKPVLMHTICRFHEFDSGIHIILVLPKDMENMWNELCAEYTFNIPHTITYGGITRFHSVKNALAYVTEKSLVAIHDGVRPLVSYAAIRRCFDEAEHTGAAIPVIDCVESIRQLSNGNSHAVDRSQYRLVQTPQVFNSEIILAAYTQPYMPHFTDDASVVETSGVTVSLVEGNRENIKITTPLDMDIAELLIGKLF